jgi:hypothetical protein
MEGRNVYKPHKGWTYHMVAVAKGVLGKPTVVINNLTIIVAFDGQKARQL